MPHNAGLYRSITVVNPRGSVLNAEYPDAVSVRNSVPYRLFDCITGAVMQATPDLLPAPSGRQCDDSVAIRDRRRRFLPRRRGHRADPLRHRRPPRRRRHRRARQHPQQHEEPADRTGRGVRPACAILEYDIRPDSGGPGQWRGGVGQVLTVEILCDGGIFLARGMDRMRFPSWGVAGGKPGGAAPRDLQPRPPRRNARSAKSTSCTCARGDTVTMQMPGGAGFGDPFLRDPEAVLSDVAPRLRQPRKLPSATTASQSNDGRDRCGENSRAAPDAQMRRKAHCNSASLPSARLWETVFTEPAWATDARL